MSMQPEKGTEEIQFRRRRLLVAGTTVIGGIGLAAVAVPFIGYMKPSAGARAAGAPVEVDISKLVAGQQMTIKWRGKPVWILRRTQAMLDVLASERLQEHLLDPDSTVDQQPGYAKNNYRSIKDEFMVVVAICTHLGCVPSYRPESAPEDLGADWMGGYYCPCHGSRFDLAGRVYKNVPAPTNLVVPPHQYVTDTILIIGDSDTNTLTS